MGRQAVAAADAAAAEGAEPAEVNIEGAVETYLHRTARAGRFGTKGLAISFVATDEDTAVLNGVQERFELEITALPETVDPSSYMNA